jgi:hypothetical protein
MGKYSIKSTKQEPFKPKFGDDKIKIEAVTDKSNKIKSFILTKGKKVTEFTGKIKTAWAKLEKSFESK